MTSIFFSFAGFALFGLAGLMFGNGDDHSGESSGLITKQGLFTLAVVLIGFGGPGVQNSVIHLANLFPAKKGLVTAIITGCFQLSFCIFYIFDQLWYFGGIDLRTIFLAHAGICLLCFLVSWSLWPDKPFQFDDQVLCASPNTRRALGPAAVAYTAAATPPPSAGPEHRLGLIRYPSMFRRPAPAEETQKAATPGFIAPHTAAALSGSIAEEEGRPEQHVQPTMPGIKEGVLTPFTGSSGNERAPILIPPRARSELKNQSLTEQLMSKEFISVTLLLTVASFWANFYIGAVGLQVSILV
jgi:hypothetical protein